MQGSDVWLNCSLPSSISLQKKILIIFSLYLGISLLSCRSVSPLSMEREKPPDRVSIEDFSPDWQFFEQEENLNLYYSSARTLNPKLELWALKIDLTYPSLRIIVNSVENGKVQSTRVSSFVRNNNCIAGINTVPFDRISAKEGEERNCAGIVISGGFLVSPPVPDYDALVFYKPHSAENNPALSAAYRPAAILPQSEISGFDAIKNALGGFHIVLWDGELPERLLTESLPRQDLPRQNLPRHPRTAAGLSSDGKILYLLVIDGRRRGSAGATETETGLLLKKLGAAQGLNFDGGGSTALALRFPDGKVRTVNTPIHSGIPGRERAVAACLAISGSKF